MGPHGWISLPLPTPTHLLQPTGGGSTPNLCVDVCICEREREELFVFSGEQMAEKRSK